MFLNLSNHFFQQYIQKVRKSVCVDSVLCWDPLQTYINHVSEVFFFLSWQTHFTGHGYHKQRSRLWIRYQTSYYLSWQI